MSHLFIITLNRDLLQFRLKRPRPKKEFDDVPFVRLQPIELDRRNRPQVQSIYLCRINKLPLELLVIRDGAAHEGGADLFQHVVLGAAYHGHEREHEFGVGQCRLG